MAYSRQESLPTVGMTIRLPVDVHEELTENSHALRMSKNSAVLEGIRAWIQMMKDSQNKNRD